MSTHPYRARPVADTHVWLTPRYILDAIGSFDLDPCAAPDPRPWPTAKRHITLPEDGLSAEWRGRVWLNPPYGANTKEWLARLAQHGDGIALVFARTETSMFERYVWPHMSAALFLYGRPHFCRPDGTVARGNSGGPMVLVAYGMNCAYLLRKCGLPGRIVE